LIVDSHQRDYPPANNAAPAMLGPRLDRRRTGKLFGASAARCHGRGANG
jgi:hypothetical protein